MCKMVRGCKDTVVVTKKMDCKNVTSVPTLPSIDEIIQVIYRRLLGQMHIGC